MKSTLTLTLVLILLALPLGALAQAAPESEAAPEGTLLERYPIVLMVNDPDAPEPRQVSAYLEVWLSGGRRVYAIDCQENTHGAAESFLNQLIEAGSPPPAEQVTAFLIGEPATAARP